MSPLCVFTKNHFFHFIYIGKVILTTMITIILRPSFSFFPSLIVVWLYDLAPDGGIIHREVVDVIYIRSETVEEFISKVIYVIHNNDKNNDAIYDPIYIKECLRAIKNGNDVEEALQIEHQLWYYSQLKRISFFRKWKKTV